MASFYMQDPGSNTWSGPFEVAAICQAVLTGRVEPTRWIWSGQPHEAPIPARDLPPPAPQPVRAPLVQAAPAQTESAPDWLKALVVIGGTIAAGALLGELLDALSSEPRRVGSGRRPQVLLPPPDPETVAIRRSAKRHLKNGAEVFADIPGWPRPPKINGHIPDVYAYYPDGREVVQEFENDRSVFSSHARRQDVAFSLHATEFEQVEYEQVVIKGGRGGRW